MRRLVAPLAATGATLALVALPAAAADGAKLTLTPNVAFPDRAFVLSTAKPVHLENGDVQVRENGEAVDHVAVLPARKAAANTFGTVLVVDATLTMTGAPIRHAMAAARAFAEQRNANHELAVVTFNRETNTLLPFTSDEADIDGALASIPPLACCTPLYDAVDDAISLVEDAKIPAGSVVVLSDGADTGSKATPQQVAERAREAGIRIFTVGLRSPAFRPTLLEHLAGTAGGQYTEAKSASSLERIYKLLSTQLANEYLVRYRSLASPSQKVVVDVAAKGIGSARASYTSPALPTAARPYHRSPVDRFFASPLSALVVAILVALVVGWAVRRILRSTAPTVERRVGQYVAVGESGQSGAREQSAGTSPSLVDQQFTALDRVLARGAWWERFKREMEISEYPMKPVPFLLVTIAATILGAVILGSVFLPVYAFFALGTPLVSRELVRRRLRAKQEAFAQQLPDNLLVLAASLRAGHSFVGALRAVVDEADEPSSSELRRAVSDEQLGVPIEEGLVLVAERMASSDLEQVALVAALQRQTGGNTAAVLDTVVDTLRDRFELRRTVQTLTAQGRMSRWILTFLPVVVFGMVSFLNREYMKPLFSTTTGQVLLALAITLIICGSLTIKRIVDIEL